MKLLPAYLRTLLTVLLLILAPCSFAGLVNLDSLNVDEYKAQLDELNARKTLTEAETRTRDDLTSIIKTMNQYRQTKEMFDEVHNAVTKSPETIKDLKKKREKQEKEYKKAKKPNLEAMSNSELSSAFHSAEQSRNEMIKLLEEEKKKLASINAISEYTQKNDQPYQDTIHNNKSRIANGGLRPLEEIALQAEISYCEFYLQYLQYLNSAHNALQELVNTRIDYYQFEYTHFGEMMEMYGHQLEVLRVNDSLNEGKELQNLISDIVINAESKSKSSAQLVAENSEYLAEIQKTIQEITDYRKESIKLRKTLERTNRIENEVNNLIDTFSSSLFLSQMMAISQKSIPEYNPPYNADELLGNVRLEQYDLNTKELQVKDEDSYIKRLQKKYDENLNQSQEDAVRNLIKRQQMLIEKYKEKLYQKVNILVNIQMNNSMYQRSKQNINDTINKKIFWLQSNQKINLNWFKTFPTMVKKEITGTETYVSGKGFWIRLLEELPKILIILAISFVITFHGKKIDSRIKTHNINVGSYRKDRHSNTPVAVLLTFLRCSNWACWSLIIGLIVSFLTIRIGTYDIGEILRADNLRISFIILLISISWHTMSEYDILKPHFQIEMSRRNRSYHIVFLLLLATLSISCTCKTLYPHTFATDVIGEVVFFVLLLLISLIMVRYTIRSFRSESASIILRVSLLGATCIPVGLIIFLYFGYYYSVVKVAERFIDTYFVIIGYLIIYYIILRSLSITSRRMAFQRKLEEREQKRKEMMQQSIDKSRNTSGSNPEMMDMDEIMPVTDISNQAQSITRLSMITIMAVILYFLWADFITVLSYLHNITLWTVSASDPAGNGIITNKISLGDTLISLYSIFMMLVIVKNLPGLLEITILNRFNSTRRISYSVKTLMTYVIIAIGLSFSLTKLGVSWDNLQWLVAALSVGLGFGLQEIFGNFVSGIIILFERPIRLGDVVTINGTTGTVTKIRIRATTITDFDKRDLIVPNKTFITSQLTNWSLNEECLTRMIINVGVGYGSNVHQVHEVLMKIAERNRFVMRTPPYYVVFIGFGESNLNFQLMVFIEKIKDFYPTIDSINTEIYNEFNRLNIEIAFNQVDLYIKNTRTGQEIKIDSTEKNNDTQKTKPAITETKSETAPLKSQMS